jgi:hypothetical protein
MLSKCLVVEHVIMKTRVDKVFTAKFRLSKLPFTKVIFARSRVINILNYKEKNLHQSSKHKSPLTQSIGLGGIYIMPNQLNLPKSQQSPGNIRQAQQMIEAQRNRAPTQDRKNPHTENDAPPSGREGPRRPESQYQPSSSVHGTYPPTNLPTARPASHVFTSSRDSGPLERARYYCRCDNPTRHWEYRVVEDDSAATLAHKMIDRRGGCAVNVLEGIWEMTRKEKK